MPHPIDAVAGLIYGLGSSRHRVFPDGWGDRFAVAMLEDAEIGTEPVEPADIVWGRKEERPGVRVRRGQFASPLAPQLPVDSASVPIELIEPGSGTDRYVVIMPAWNDHGFEQRRRLARLIVQAGIGAIMFDIPFYGARRVTRVRQQAIRTVGDFALMGVGAVKEALAITAATPGQIGVTGFSMGGNLAALVSAVADRSIATSAVAASHSPGPVYLDGVLSRAIDWEALGGRDQAEGLRSVLGSASALRYAAKPHHKAAVLVAAARDGFVPLEAASQLAEHWGAELRMLPGGHATALWRHRPAMAQAVADSFERTIAID